MKMDQSELRRLKEYIVADYREGSIEEGRIVTISCPTDIAWEDTETGKKHSGCGIELARFIYTGEEETWDIAADLYLSHLHNAHGYRVPISPIDLTQ